jgi:hypothetical protein
VITIRWVVRLAQLAPTLELADRVWRYHSGLAPRSDLLAIALRAPANLSGNYWSGGPPVAVGSQIVGATYDTSGALTSPVVGAGAP